MAGLLSIGVSGLQASQAQLNTVGHNITNADTAGYSRQQVTQKTAGGQYIGPAGFIGSGTTLQDVNRLLNQFEATRKMMKQFSGGKGKKGRMRMPFHF